jgi:hypothetical protein
MNAMMDRFASPTYATSGALMDSTRSIRELIEPIRPAGCHVPNGS